LFQVSTNTILLYHEDEFVNSAVLMSNWQMYSKRIRNASWLPQN